MEKSLYWIIVVDQSKKWNLWGSNRIASKKLEKKLYNPILLGNPILIMMW